MAFSVRNSAVERKVREFARENGKTLTGGIEYAIDELNALNRQKREEEFRAFRAKIRAIQERVAQLPDSGLSEDEIMGWDADGLPT